MHEQTWAKPSQEQVALLNLLRKLWIDHVLWTRSFLTSTAFDNLDLQAVTAELLRNPVHFANALGALYGDQTADRFEKLFTEHLMIAASLVNAFKEGNMAAAQEQHEKWYQNADEIARFLAEINPAWKRNVWQKLLYDHLGMTENEAALILTEKYSQSIEEYNRIEEEALMMADVMAYGIMRQFPTLSRG